MELSPNEQGRLRAMAESIIIKDARSAERLLAETSLFLHRVSSKLPPMKRQILEQEQRTDPSLAGKKILVIDDDVRNIFSLTSLLERYRMEVLFAENGREGLDVLNGVPDVDAILVDVMMPDIDGYETIRQIRKMPEFESRPIIALTAKAMKGDREKCIEAGASDYVAKPADVDRLLSLLRLYLGRN
jgi:CheY-like chemotaxis protein